MYGRHFGHVMKFRGRYGQPVSLLGHTLCSSFSTLLSNFVVLDDRMSRGGRGRQSKRATRIFLQTPKTHRGVWETADFQYYISKMEPQAFETSEWANLGMCAHSVVADLLLDLTL